MHQETFNNNKHVYVKYKQKSIFVQITKKHILFLRIAQSITNFNEKKSTSSKCCSQNCNNCKQKAKKNYVTAITISDMVSICNIFRLKIGHFSVKNCFFFLLCCQCTQKKESYHFILNDVVFCSSKCIIVITNLQHCKYENTNENAGMGSIQTKLTK